MAQDKKTVLIVDDDPFILSATERVLRAAGHEVHTCHEWVGVAAKVRESSPHLVLMDYNMPSLTGDHVCAILKRNMPGETKIVIFSSEPEAMLTRIVADCGADGFVKKNVPGSELLQAVDTMLAGCSSAF